MKNSVSKTFCVGSDQVDFARNYDLRHLMHDFHDLTGIHSVDMGIDSLSVYGKYNAMWIVSRIRISFYGSMPAWRDEISVETFPLAPGIVRMERECVFRRADGSVFARLGSEWCLLDASTGRPRRPLQTGYPADIVHRERELDTDYTRMDFKSEKRDFAFEHTVRVSDLDMNGHMNNVAYIVQANDAFSLEKLTKNRISGFEIAFKAQCYEGDTLRVFRRLLGGGVYAVYADKPDGTRVFDSMFTLTAKE